MIETQLALSGAARLSFEKATVAPLVPLAHVWLAIVFAWLTHHPHHPHHAVGQHLEAQGARIEGCAATASFLTSNPVAPIQEDT